MTIKNSKLQANVLCLPTILTIGVLSIGLLLSGCSDRAPIETETATEDTSNTDPSVNAVKPSANDVAGQKEITDTTLESEQKVDSTENETSMANDTINPATSSNPVTSSLAKNSLVTNPTAPGTPEDTLKQALDTLYFGDAKDAVRYYDVDMVDFANELAKTQSAFQQTVEGVTLLGTQYNEDKTLATINGEIRLKGQSKPAPLAYQLKKVKGQWKILG